MQPLRIFLFGAPRIEQLDKIVTIPRRKVVSLLAYLAVTNQPQSRDTLATLFWPDHDQSGARANLRRDLSRLRSLLGEDALTINRSQIGLADDFDFWLDVAVFRHALNAVRDHAHAPEQLCPSCLAQLTEAAALYGADFLAGFSLPDCPEFDEWLFFEAEGLRAGLAEMLQRLIAWHTAQAAYAQAVEYGRRWLSLDTLHEPAHRALMQLYAWDGQQAAAQRQYQECVRILADELGVEPEAETAVLYEQIKSRQLSQPENAPEAAPQVRPDGPRLVPAQAAALPPHERYVAERPLASGGHGQLFLGTDRLTDDPVVIKRLKQEIVAQDPTFIERFAREGDLLRQLNHPNIVRMFATFEHDGERSIVMEYVPGGSLRQRLDAPDPLSLDDALTIGLELADALSRAHHLGVLHRDIKPDNVLLAADGTPRLTDFGTARLVRPNVRLTPTGAWLGSPAYMSPEALLGHELDVRSDVWSLGVMLYEVIAGQRPFPGDQMATILINIINEPLRDLSVLRPEVPPALNQLLQQMMVKEPEMRLASMRQVAAALEAIRGGQEIIHFTPAPQANGLDVATAVPTTSPAAPAPPTVPHNLTPPSTPFIGRTVELARLHQLLAEEPTCRLLTLVGPGGVGKTRLARQAARQQLPTFADGVFFVPLAPVSEAAYVVTAVAEAIGLRFSGATEPKMQLLHFLRQKALLLVLDNFEHLLDGAPLLAEMLALNPELKLLVTSRERLDLPEEWQYEMAGLPFPRQLQEAGTDRLGTFSAVQLFVQCARRSDARFSLTAENGPAILRICQLVDGMPLGLELAAAWVRAMSCQEIAEEITRSVAFLTTTDSRVPDRHRSLQAIFAQSWQRLPESERLIGRKLAVFRGGCLRDAAEQVAGATLGQLSLLVDRSLLRRDRHGRFAMHELIRQFALAELEAEPETQRAVQQRHSDYYLDFLAQHTADIKGSGQTAVLTEIAAEIDNVRLAWQYAVAHGHREGLEQAATTLWLFCEFRGLLHEGEAAFAAAVTAFAGEDLTAVPHGAETLVGFARAGQGSLLARRGWFEDGRMLMEEGIRIMRRAAVVDAAKEAFALAWLAFCCLIHGRYEDVVRFAQAGLDRFPHTGDRWTRAGCLRLLGAAALNQGQLAAAVQHLQACLTACQEIGERRIQTFANLNLGIIARMQGNFVQAAQYLDEAQQTSEALGDRLSRVAVLNEWGQLYLARGDYDRAVAAFQDSQAVQEAIGRSDEGWVQGYLGAAYRLQGDAEAAERAFRNGLAVSKALGVRPNVAFCLSGLGHLASDQGQYSQAEQAQQEALVIWQKIDNEPEMAAVHRHLGDAVLAGGPARRLEAQAHYRQGLVWAQQHGLVPLVMDLLLGVGELLRLDGEVEMAVTLLALAQTHPAATAATRRQAADLLDKTTVHLSASVVQAAMARRPEWPEAVALALERLAPPLPASGLLSSNLPPEQTPFFGREAELARIHKMLAAPECRLVTVAGLGGMGKSRLALEAARQVAKMAERPFPHGVYFVSLAGVTVASVVPAAIADTLNLALTGSGSPVVQIVNFLASKSVLLLLDNFEHLLDDPAQSDVAVGLVTAVLAGCPGVKLLVTSREPLQLEAEWRLTLEGLSFARDEAGAIDAFGATQLFVQTAGQVQPNFALLPELVPTVRRICQLTAGTPLALKLAAAWLRAVPLTQIAAEMEKNLDILATNWRDVPARQRSMRVVFDYTWQLLTPPEQAAFCGLAVFCGGFTAEAALSVAQASPFVLAGLIDRGLLQTQAGSGENGQGDPPRYVIHELARQYAARQATAAEHTALADAHARYFADFAWQRRKTIQQSEHQTAVDELAIELNNITTAWYWLLTRLDDPEFPAAELLGQLAYTLKHFYYNRGPLHSAQQLFLEAVAQMQAAGWETDDEDAAAVATRLALSRMQVRAAFFSFGVSEYETADRLLQPALDWLERRQLLAELGLARSVLAKCYLLRGERQLAEAHTREAMALLEPTDELYEYADALKVLGIVAVDDGRYDEGMAYYEQALALHRQEGFLPGIQQLLHNMGTTHFRQGHHEPALQFYREALATAEQAGIRRGIMHTGDALGGVNRILGNFQDAVAYHEKAIGLARELGEQRWLAATLNNLGQTHVWMGKVKSAVGYLQEGLALAWETENVPDALASLTYLAEAWARQGHVLPAFGLAFFLVDQPQIRANVKKTASDLLEELQNELPAGAAAAAQQWAAAHDLPAVVASARSGPPIIQMPSAASTT